MSIVVLELIYAYVMADFRKSSTSHNYDTQGTREFYFVHEGQNEKKKNNNNIVAIYSFSSVSFNRVWLENNYKVYE